MTTTNGEDIRCGMCGGDALEVTPGARDDVIIYETWVNGLREHGKVNPATGHALLARCGYCTEIFLNKPTKTRPGKTFYEVIQEMRER